MTEQNGAIERLLAKAKEVEEKTGIEQVTSFLEFIGLLPEARKERDRNRAKAQKGVSNAR